MKDLVRRIVWSGRIVYALGKAGEYTSVLRFSHISSNRKHPSRMPGSQETGKMNKI